MAVCRERSQSHGREVLPVYEPSWTARTCLQTAYERLIPLQCRSTSVHKTPQRSDPTDQPIPQNAKLPNTAQRRSVA